jgi:hypothetical protein
MLIIFAFVRHTGYSDSRFPLFFSVSSCRFQATGINRIFKRFNRNCYIMSLHVEVLQANIFPSSWFAEAKFRRLHIIKLCRGAVCHTNAPFVITRQLLCSKEDAPHIEQSAFCVGSYVAPRMPTVTVHLKVTP